MSFDTLPQQVERHARLRPDAPAVRAPDGSLSYRQLNEAANRLAAHFAAADLRAGDLAGILLPRGSQYVTTILAILRSGCAYLPLDTSYPVHRLRAVIEQANPRTIVTNSGELSEAFGSVSLVRLDRDAETIAGGSATTPRIESSPDTLCYVIFTSGSTGEPKGVMVTHGNVARLFDGSPGGLTQRLACRSDDVWSQLHSCAFGFSVFEIWGALSNGACLAIAPDAARGDARLLGRFLRDAGVTILAQTPSEFRETSLAGLNGAALEELPLRAIVLSGEPVNRQDLRQWFAGPPEGRPRLINTYAVTETGGNLLFREYTSANSGEGESPLGSPLPGASLHVLDSALRAAPAGAVGELYVSGPGVAQGYLGDNGLTASRFVTIPGVPGLSYRTGDRVRVNASGEYEFCGRADEQVKWRGQRLELGEIESLLRSHPGVSAAAAALRSDHGDERLVAYVVAGATPEFWPSLGAHQVYDQFLHDLMSTDEARNRALRAAFAGQANGKVVLDLGTGPNALLARMAVDAGARHVYAVEIDTSAAGQARVSVAAAGLADRITVIAGDAGNLRLPEPVDLCAQGIIGNIGSADGIAPIWNAVRRHFRGQVVPVPLRCRTMIAPVELPESLRTSPRFTPLAEEYVSRMFASAGRRFDVRLCVRNLSPAQLLGEPLVFEDLDFRGPLSEATESGGEFMVSRHGRIDGFLLWTEVTMCEGQVVDYLANQYAWLPVFFPLPENGSDVQAGERLHAQWRCEAGPGERAPDYSITVSWGEGDGRQRARYVTRHREPALNGTAIHRRLWAPLVPAIDALTPAELRAWLSRHLPDSLLPNAWMYLPALPINANGKLDRKALPAPVAQRVWGGHGGGPRGALESDIAALWSELLGVAAVGRLDNFFDLGGDSIGAVRLTTRLQQLLDADVMLAAIFESPTVAGLAQYLERQHEDSVARRYGGRRGGIDARPDTAGANRRELNKQ
jgi:amino acid adenylation domain-containing protein